jgi:hypothetical protein
MDYNQEFISFDIETSAIPYETFSESQREYLIRGAKTDEEKQKKIDEMALYPMTSQVAAICMKIIKYTDKNELTEKNVALMTNPELDDEETSNFQENQTYYYEANETNVIQTFWKTLAKYKSATLISFNGRSFDAPFLMLRSAILNIIPTRNLMNGTKFNYSQHIDLLDELTFYSNTFYGATKRFNFDFYTKAFGLKSPKSEGVDGSKVGELFKNKEYKVIADYCLRDVDATWLLYNRIKDYLFLS